MPGPLTPSFKRTLAEKLQLAGNLRLTCRKFSYNSLLCDTVFYDCQLISNLKRLHLSIRGADESDDKVDPDWFVFLKPLQAYVTGIEYLYIHVVHDILELEHSNNEVLDIVRFPRL